MNQNMNSTDIPLTAGTEGDSSLQIFGTVRLVLLGVSFFVSLMGVVTNSMNIAVFSRLWRKDTINISLFAMAVSDLVICLLAFTNYVIDTPASQWVIIKYLNWVPREFTFLFLGMTHRNFTRTTMMITAFITMERCICVAIPLRVKMIFTRGRVQIYMVICFLFGSLAYAPTYYTYDVGWLYRPEFNRTLMGYMINLERYDRVKSWSRRLNITFSYGFQFSIINVCSLILIITLNRRSLWRQQVTSTSSDKKKKGSGGGISIKERKVIKMMVTIAGLFIICFISDVVMLTWAVYDSGFRLNGTRRHLYILLAYVSSSFGTLSSSLNFFIYYTHSSNFREIFHAIVCPFIKKRKE